MRSQSKNVLTTVALLAASLVSAEGVNAGEGSVVPPDMTVENPDGVERLEEAMTRLVVLHSELRRQYFVLLSQIEAEEDHDAREGLKYAIRGIIRRGKKTEEKMRCIEAWIAVGGAVRG